MPPSSSSAFDRDAEALRLLLLLPEELVERRRRDDDRTDRSTAMVGFWTLLFGMRPFDLLPRENEKSGQLAALARVFGVLGVI